MLPFSELFKCAGVLKEQWHTRRTYCDYDGRLPRRLLSIVRAVANICNLHVHWIRIDRTRRGYHMIVHWNIPLLPAEQVALQFALGSDNRRETLNLMRVISLSRHPSEAGKRGWNLLFSRKLE